VKDLFEPVDRRRARPSPSFPIDAHCRFDYSPAPGGVQYNGLKVLEKGAPRWRAHPAAVVPPEALRRGDRGPTATSRPCRKRCAPPLLQQPSPTGRTRHEPEIRAKGHELESRSFWLSEVKPTNSSPLVCPAAVHRHLYVNDLFAASWNRGQRGWGLQGAGGASRYRGSLTPWNGDTFQLLWPGSGSPHRWIVAVSHKPIATGSEVASSTRGISSTRRPVERCRTAAAGMKPSGNPPGRCQRAGEEILYYGRCGQPGAPALARPPR